MGRNMHVLILAVALCLSSVVQVSSQNSSQSDTKCTVSITQTNATTYVTTITCTGPVDPAIPLTVVAANSTANLTNLVNYTYNGANGNLTSPSPFTDLHPALVTMGFNDPAADINYYIIYDTGYALPSLEVTASVNDVNLPIIGTAPASLLRFTAVSSLLISDSTFFNVKTTQTDSNSPAASVMFVSDSLMPPDAVPITIQDSSFTLVNSTKSAGAVTLMPMPTQGYANVSIINSNFTACSAGGSGAAINIFRCSGTGSDASDRVVIDGSRFIQNTAAGSGGALYLGTQCSPIITNSLFGGNTAGQSGGALNMVPGLLSTLEINNTRFLGNVAGTNCGPGFPTCITATTCGGALAISNSTNMAVYGSTFGGNQNVHGEKGGAVCYGRLSPTPRCYAEAESSPSTGGLFKNTTFISNSVVFDQSGGGAIYDYASKGLTIDNCTFLNNTAGNGGAIFSLWADYLAIKGNSTFQGSAAQYVQGGAVAVSDLIWNMTVEDTVFVDNACTSTTQQNARGGAIYMERQLNELFTCIMPHNFTAAISNVNFTNNSCHGSGALHLTGLAHSIGPNVVFENNTAFYPGLAGGAVGLYTPTTELTLLPVPLQSNITGSTFRNNFATANGGAVRIFGLFQPNITTSVFENNSVTSTASSSLENTGGAIFVSDMKLVGMTLDGVTFTNNSADSGAGLLALQVNVTTSSCSFDNNTANSVGGAISWLQAGSSNIPFLLNISGSNFTNNTARNAGAVQVANSAVMIYNSRFENNFASESGGAAVLNQIDNGAGTSLLYQPIPSGFSLDVNESIYIINSVFQNNTANLLGGGAFYTSSSRAIVSNSSFYNNTSPVGSGGAIYSFACLGPMNFYGGTFQGNSVGGSGGGIFSSSCDVTFNGTQLLSNSAASGGAITSGVILADLIHPGKYVTELNDCTAQGNNATSVAGGCLKAGAVNVTLLRGSFTGNTAATNGGVLSVETNSMLSMRSVTLMKNNAALTGLGGAVYVDSMTLVDVQDCIISNNSAPGGLNGQGGCISASNNQCILVQNTSLSGCQSNLTGGGFFLSLPQVPLGCTSDLLQPVLPKLSPMAMATAPSSDKLALVMHHSDVDSSSAGGSGGGMAIQLAPGSRALLDQVTVTGNTASTADGGGMRISVSSAASTAVAAVNITSSSIASNTALVGQGGGVAVHSPGSQFIQVNLLNSSITNNTAANGGGVAVQNPGASVSIQFSSTMSNNAALSPAGSKVTDAGAQGGCIYGEQCQAVVVSSGSSLSSCSAGGSAGGNSQGGGIMASGCMSVVVNGSSITNSSATVGGGLAAADVAAIIVDGSSFSFNAANGTAIILPGAIDLMVGTGGAVWVDGNSSALLHGSQFTNNTAGVLGGALAVLTACPSNASDLLKTPLSTPGWVSQLPASLSSYQPILSGLATRTSVHCYSTTVQLSFIKNNTAQNSGGGVFAARASGFKADSCSDLFTPTTTSPADLPSYSQSEDLSNLVGCAGDSANDPYRNQNMTGYGPTIATLAKSLYVLNSQVGLYVNPVDAQAAAEVAANSSSAAPTDPVPIVRITDDGSLVLPSTSPFTQGLVPLSIQDAAGQNVTDPLLSTAITISATSNTTDENTLAIYGQHIASYDTSANSFSFNGIGLRAVVGMNYTFLLNMSSTMSGGDNVPIYYQNVLVPDCYDGEIYVLGKQACYQCPSGSYAWAGAPGELPDNCLPCVNGADCSVGGAVLVPTANNWHSAPNSSQIHNCANYHACVRSDDKVAQLEACQAAWYQYLNSMQTMSEAEIQQYAQLLVDAFNCTLLTGDQLNDPIAYQNLLCADGYGGNLCGVCVPNSEGVRTSIKSNGLCGPCAARWQVVLIAIAFFFVNLLMIAVQVVCAMGEQILSNTIQFSDIIGMMITHLQYLVVVLKLQMTWPSSVTGLARTVSAVTNFAEQALKVASLGCLSQDGSPESQARYTMAGGLVIPAALCLVSVLIWAAFWAYRVKVLYPSLGVAITKSSIALSPPKQIRSLRRDEQEESPPSSEDMQTKALPNGGHQGGNKGGYTGASDVPPASMMQQYPTFSHPHVTEKYPDIAGMLYPSPSAPANHPSRLQAAAAVLGPPPAAYPSLPRIGENPIDVSAIHLVQASSMNRFPTIGMPGPENSLSEAHSMSMRAPAYPPMHPHATTFNNANPSDAYPAVVEPSNSAPANYSGWDKVHSALAGSAIPLADIDEDLPAPDGRDSVTLGVEKSSGSLARWQLPGAEKAPQPTGWFSTDDAARHARMLEERFTLSFFENLRLLDKYMPLQWQLLAVAINAMFVIYEGWSASALSVFACTQLDTGLPGNGEPDYYAQFQQATAPGGYWQVNMNQACYEGNHLHKWTPIGVVMSVIICLGVPLVTFLVVFLNRRTLTTAKTQLYWGWMYMRFYYTRVPYWGAFAQLELLTMVVVQTFTSGLNSNLQQAAYLEVTLLVIVIINTVVWPHVHQLMTLMSFMSFAILTLTVCLSIIIGDGSSWVLSQSSSDAVGWIIIILNVLFVAGLILVSYRHTQDVLEEHYLAYRNKFSGGARRLLQRSRDAGRQMKSMATVVTRNMAKSAEESRMLRPLASVLRRSGQGARGSSDMDRAASAAVAATS